MRSQDFAKLTANGEFRIFRINETGNHSFILKEYVCCPNGLWEVVSAKNTYDEVLNEYIHYRTKTPYPLLSSSLFTTFDLQEICHRGFRILRENNEDTYSVEEYNSDTLKWKMINRFNCLFERCAFMNQQLNDSKTISIDM